MPSTATLLVVLPLLCVMGTLLISTVHSNGFNYLRDKPAPPAPVPPPPNPGPIQKPNITTVHIIAHSHQDAGWLETPDDYFRGTVSTVLTNVYKALISDSTKKFTHAEVWFFSKWWELQPDDVKTNFKQLLKDGRFEFVNGGWVASDEACPTFEDLIENIVVGHQYLWKEFGVTPKIVWHADAFGHTMTTAQIFKDLGYDAYFFSRISDKERTYRQQNQSMEFMWKNKYSRSDGSETIDDGIFTHLTHHHYSPDCNIHLQNFFYKSNIQNAYQNEINGFKNNPTTLLNCFQNYVDAYQTSHILHMWGDDFSYYNADLNYWYMDQLIEIVNNHSDKYQFKYSTPSEYATAVKQEFKDRWLSIPVYQGDLVPLQQQYTDGYWVGYYSSRPSIKKYIRDFSAQTYTSSSLYSMNFFKKQTINQDQFNISTKNRQLLGLMMHHDTITGTSMQKVVDNAVNMLNSQFSNNSQYLINEINSNLDALGITLQDISLCQSQHNKRIGTCPSIQDSFAYNLSTSFVLAVHNPTVYDLEYTHFRISHSHVSISLWDQRNQSFKAVNYSEAFCNLNSDSQNECDIYVYQSVPYLGFQILKVDYNSSNDLSVASSDSLSITLQASTLSVVSSDSDTIRFQYTKGNTITQEFDFNFQKYKEQSSSGVYLFKVSDPNSSRYQHTVSSTAAYQGKNSSQLVIRYTNEKNEQSIVKVKLQQNSDQIEFDVFFIRIPQNYESESVSITFKSTTIVDQDHFFTDSNGAGMVKRIIDEKKPYDTRTTQRQAKNYYPVNSAIMIEDSNMTNQMIVMNDRPQGGSAFQNGRIEFVINRRVLSQDGLGMPEKLDEKDSSGNGYNVSAKFYVEFTQNRETAFSDIAKRFSLTTHQPNILYAKNYTLTGNKINDNKKYGKLRSDLKNLLDLNGVQNLYFSVKNETTILLRLVSTFRNITHQVKPIIGGLCQVINVNEDINYCDGLNLQIKEFNLNGINEPVMNQTINGNGLDFVAIKTYQISRNTQQKEKLYLAFD